jgi:AraC family transcriptional regulator, melibiose operon regulatory protein
MYLDPKVASRVGHFFDQSRRDFTPYGFTCERWTPARMPRPDRHNEVEINLLSSGSLTYLVGGGKVKVPAGRLAIFWAAIPHQIIDVQGAAGYYVATIPLAWFLQCRFPEHLVQPVLHGEVLLDRAADPDDPRRFARWLDDLGADPKNRQRPVFLEMEARLCRLALALSPPAVKPLRGARHASIAAEEVVQAHLSKVEQMAAFIAMNYTEPLTVDDVGEHVGLHPNHAMTVFKRAFGTTLIQYVTEHRISHAKRLLVASGEKVLSIAMASGFGSVSRFNAAFRETCGCSPRAFRDQHRL